MRSVHRSVSLKALLVVVTLLGILLSPAGSSMAEGGYSLAILHTNDTHAHLEPFTPFGESSQGGVARRATLIKQIRAERPNVLLVDAGDAFQGTLFFNQWQGEEASHFMNTLGYQAMALGNHEFDSGPGTLGSFVRAAKFPVVSSNVNVSAEPELAGNIKSHVVLEVGGERIGIMGLTTPDTTSISSPGPRVTFAEPIASATAAVKALTDQGINKIVCLSHLGYTDDQKVAAAVSGIDVIVGGHSHTKLGGEGADGPYPTVVRAPDGGQVLVVSAHEWGKYLGRLDVTFGAKGEVLSYAGQPIFIDGSIAEDADIRAQVARFAQPIATLRARTVGTSAVLLDGERKRVRGQETNLGNLICDALLWATARQGTQIAITNGGGIRSTIPAGTVTMGHVLETLPFGNQIATFELKGADIVAALENGVAGVEEGKGQFPQVGGMRYSFDRSAPVGKRITGVEVKQADGSYAPLVTTETYRVVSNDFMRRGGDGYVMFAEKAINPYDGGAVMADAVADYIRSMSPVNATLEGRITESAGAISKPAAQSTVVKADVPVQQHVLAGILAGTAGGATQSVTLSYDKQTKVSLTLRFAPDDPVISKAFGVEVYGPSGKVADGVYAGTHGARTIAFQAEPGRSYTLKVFNYLPGSVVGFSVN